MAHDKPHSMVNNDDHSDKGDFIDSLSSPTILTGGVISEGTNAGTFKVSALTALLRTGATNSSPLKKMTLVEQDNQAITLADTFYYVILEYNGDSPRIQLSITRGNGQTNLCMGKVLKETDNTVHYLNAGNRLISGVHRLHQRAAELRNLEIASGLIIADEGSKKFSISSGVVYRGINRFVWSIFDTSDASVFTYVYYNYNTSSWVYVADQTDINVDQYNLTTSGDGLASCNKYKCDWVFVHPEDGYVYIVYGQDNALLPAILDSTVPTLPDLVDIFGILIGRIVVDGGVTTFERTEQIVNSTFNRQVVINHNDNSNIQGGQTDERYHLTSAQHTNIYSQGDEIKIKIYSQVGEPVLGAKERLVMWIDTDDSYRVYLIFSRFSGDDQVKVELT